MGAQKVILKSESTFPKRFQYAPRKFAGGPVPFILTKFIRSCLQNAGEWCLSVGSRHVVNKEARCAVKLPTAEYTFQKSISTKKIGLNRR